MAFLRLPVLLVCCVTPFMVSACSVVRQVDGLHMRCTERSLTAFPDISPDDVVWLDMSHNELSHFPNLPFLSQVHHLNLSHNAITKLDHTALLAACDLQSLDASYNQLTAVNEDTFGNLTALTTLLLHHNNITWLADDAFLGLSNLLTLNLKNNNLTSLSPGNFRGLRRLTSLGVSHNHLETLDNNTFVDLVSLRCLDVNDNHLHHLEPLAFVGLNQLKEIKLNQNQLRFQHASLPPGVFAPLKSVEIFDLAVNRDQTANEFPQAVFNDLVSVKYFSIDSFFGLYFGADFTKMSSINTLDLSHNCQAHLLRNNTFYGFKNSSLQKIVAPSCRLVSIEKCAFCDLPHLRYLDLSHNSYLKPHEALLSLYGLQGQVMEEINFGHIGRLLPIYYSVHKKDIIYLKNICVDRLSLARSHLQQWKVSAVADTHGTEFARCIRYLDVSENHMAGDVGALVIMLFLYKNLTSFHLQEQKLYSIKNSACILGRFLDCYNHGSGNSPKGNISIFMPPNLTYMNICSAFGFFNAPPSVLHFKSATNLKSLDLSYGAFARCLTTFTGLDHLETLDLSGNYCNKISDNLFDHLPSLRHLYLSSSYLTVADVRTRAQRLLRTLTRLETLDLSWNWLLEIEGASLPEQKQLQKLLLSHNSFQSLPVNLDLHPNLTLLDLSFNSITSLTSSERMSLDILASRHPVRFELSGNPLLCACSNLDFLQWLWDTSVTLDDEGSNSRGYTCTSDTGEITDTEQVMADWQYLWRRCLGQQLFGWTLAAFFMQLLGLLASFLISRRWTYLKYVWNVLRQHKIPTHHQFQKDVYIAYADDDAYLACAQLPQRLQGHDIRILLRHLEEVPGSVMADNIVQFIDDSWKVLLLVTRAFAVDDWLCGFTVHQAQRSITDTLPNRVLVVFMEDPRLLPPMASLGKLLRYYSEQNVFHVPKDAPVHHPVWDWLARAILE